MKNKTSVLLIVMILLTALALISISGTYSKYTTTTSGTGTVTIAKWDINFKNGESKLSNEFNVDLMKGSGYFKPGDSKSIEIDVENKSDVDATISAVVDKNALDAVFGEGQITYSEVLTIGDQVSETGILAAGTSGKLTITCTWPYENSKDTEDTAVGIASASAQNRTTANIAISLTATQTSK